LSGIDELKWVQASLEQQGIMFWIDSGTLLGIIREGALLDNDNDLDLGVWADDEDKLLSVANYFKEKGYNIFIRSYLGEKFKFRFVPNKNNMKLEIDINLFRRKSSYAWCPQVFRIDNPYNYGSILYYLSGLPRYFIQKCYKNKSQAEVTTWPWHLTYRVYSWWVPAHFYDNIIKIDEGFPVPKNYQEYLTFRYGDWRIPNKNWSFFTDDRAIKYIKPEDLTGKLR